MSRTIHPVCNLNVVVSAHSAMTATAAASVKTDVEPKNWKSGAVSKVRGGHRWVFGGKNVRQNFCVSKSE